MRELAPGVFRLEPAVIGFGHGAPMRDTHKFVDFVDGLPG